MRLAIAVALVAALAACSGKKDQPASAPANDAAPVAADPAPAPAAAKPSLTASVSDLHADISGLNVRETEFGTVVDLPTDTLFEFDKADLVPGADANLAKVAELIRSAPAGDIRIVGHTDSKGEDAYNQKLSERRAQTVATWIGEQVGVRQRKFDVSGKGEQQPIAPNQKPDGSDDTDGRAKNRRVEVVIPR